MIRQQIKTLRRSVLLLSFVALSFLLLAADAKQKDDPWVSMEERVKIWDEVVSNNDK